jgi:hypothetical protein
MSPSRLWPFLLSVLLTSCVPITPADPAQNSATESLELLSAAWLTAPQKRHIDGLDVLEVLQSPDALVTLRCHNTPMHLLFPELLVQAGAAYQLGRVVPSFWVSADLQQVPLDQALDLLFAGSSFEPHELHLEGGSFWTVRDRREAPVDVKGPQTHVVVGLQHVPAKLVIDDLLRQGGSLNLGPKQVTSAAIDPSSVALVGPEEAVSSLSHRLRQLDRPPPTVLLRVRKFTTYEQLVESYFGGSGGGVFGSGGPITSALLPNSLLADPGTGSLTNVLQSGSLIGLVNQTADNPLSVSANLNGLVQRVRQDYYADTQLSVLSGKTAELKLGRTGYLLTPVYSGGLVTNTSQEVDATTDLRITPTVLPSGEIRLAVTYSSYRLLQNELFGLIGTVRGSNLNLEAQVPPGQPVLLAGRDIRVTAAKRQGWPWLRKIPGMGFFFQGSSDSVLENLGIFVIWAEVVTDSQVAEATWKSQWLSTPPGSTGAAISDAETARVGWHP